MISADTAKERMEFLKVYMADLKNCYDGRELAAGFGEYALQAAQMDPPFEAAQAYFAAYLAKRAMKSTGAPSTEPIERFQAAIKLCADDDSPAGRTLLSLSENAAGCGVYDTIRFPDTFTTRGPAPNFIAAAEGLLERPLQTDNDIVRGSDYFAERLAVTLTGKPMSSGEIAKAFISGELKPDPELLPELYSFQLTAIGDSLSLQSEHHLANELFTWLVDYDQDYYASRFQWGRAAQRALANGDEEAAHRLVDIYSGLVDLIIRKNPQLESRGPDIAKPLSETSPVDLAALVSSCERRIATREPLAPAASLLGLSKLLVERGKEGRSALLERMRLVDNQRTTYDFSSSMAALVATA